MVQYNDSALDRSFAALADPTRRGVLTQLGRGDATITDLSQSFGMSLTGIKKHIGVLEQAGFVVTEKAGRVRTCRLGARRMEDEAAWIEGYRRMWEVRFVALDSVLNELLQKEQDNAAGT